MQKLFGEHYDGVLQTYVWKVIHCELNTSCIWLYLICRIFPFEKTVNLLIIQFRAEIQIQFMDFNVLFKRTFMSIVLNRLVVQTQPPSFFFCTGSNFITHCEVIQGSWYTVTLKDLTVKCQILQGNLYYYY